jgi:hypothetical protein
MTAQRSRRRLAGPMSDGARRKRSAHGTDGVAVSSLGVVDAVPVGRRACVPARQAAPLDQAAVSAPQRLVGNRGVSALLGGTLQRQVPPSSGTPPAADVRPTYGNLPREVPQVNVQRVELRIIKGKWRQVYPNGKWHSATGKYVFVIQDGKIYAQRARPGVGHTEVARGERVSWGARWTSAATPARSRPGMRARVTTDRRRACTKRPCGLACPRTSSSNTRRLLSARALRIRCRNFR